MRKINLLPWRKKHIIRNSIMSALIQTVLLIIVVTICISINKKMLTQQQTVKKQQQALLLLRQQWQQKHTIAIKQQQMQQQQKIISMQFNTLLYVAQHLPQQSQLQSIKLNAQSLALTGTAKNQYALNAIAALSKRIPYYTEQKQWQVDYQNSDIHFSLELIHD